MRGADLRERIAPPLEVVEFPSNIRVVRNFGPDLPRAVIDKQRIGQVFINLANNAIQAMARGGELRISTCASNNSGFPGPSLQVRFADTGTGIAQDDMKEIFEPMFTTKAKGTGLGLAICQGIVDKHGGKILVESEVGKGSVFTVHLPLVMAPEVPNHAG